MLRIAIVEDNKEEREHIYALTQEYLQEKKREAEILLFADGADFLDQYPSSLSVVFLDIDMPRLSGMDTARRLRSFDQTVQILFVTCLLSYAIEGYQVDAADFLLKPVSYPLFSTRLDRVMEKIAYLTPRFLMTSYAKEPLSFQVQEICYIESLNKKTIIHLCDEQEYYSSEPLYALEEKLSKESFFRCHNGFLVNLGKVLRVSAGEAMVPGASIPISKYRKKEFMQRLADLRGRIL